MSRLYRNPHIITGVMTVLVGMAFMPSYTRAIEVVGEGNAMVVEGITSQQSAIAIAAEMEEIFIKAIGVQYTTRVSKNIETNLYTIEIQPVHQTEINNGETSGPSIDDSAGEDVVDAIH